MVLILFDAPAAMKVSVPFRAVSQKSYRSVPTPKPDIGRITPSSPVSDSEARIGGPVSSRRVRHSEARPRFCLRLGSTSHSI